MLLKLPCLEAHFNCMYSSPRDLLMRRDHACTPPALPPASACMIERCTLQGDPLISSTQPSKRSENRLPLSVHATPPSSMQLRTTRKQLGPGLVAATFAWPPLLLPLTSHEPSCQTVSNHSQRHLLPTTCESTRRTKQPNPLVSVTQSLRARSRHGQP